MKIHKKRIAQKEIAQRALIRPDFLSNIGKQLKILFIQIATAMEIEDRLAAIEKNQQKILRLFAKNERCVPEILTLKKAAEYVGFSSYHFSRLAVEQRVIPFSRSSGHQKGKLLLRKLDLDRFLDESVKAKEIVSSSGRKRKSTDICFW